jgi:hypothetical protein
LIKLITEIALGYVVGNILWEILLAAALWSGRAAVRGVVGIFRMVVEQRKVGNG